MLALRIQQVLIYAQLTFLLVVVFVLHVTHSGGRWAGDRLVVVVVGVVLSRLCVRVACDAKCHASKRVSAPRRRVCAVPRRSTDVIYPGRA